MVSILALSGSLRKLSANTALTRAAVMASSSMVLAPPLDLLPFFNEDLEQNGMPQPVRDLRELAFSASGFFFATPEYNGFTSAVLKNAMDWLSRDGPEGVSPLKGKPFAVVSAGGSGGGCSGGFNISAIGARFKMKYIVPDDIPIAVKLFDGVTRFDPVTGNVIDKKLRDSISGLVVKLEKAAKET